MPAPVCGVCRSACSEIVCALPLHVRGGIVPSTIWKCARCGTWVRDTDYDSPIVRTHFEITSYTDPAAEERSRRDREPFFRHVLALCERHLRRPLAGSRLLDVGCAYGHLLDVARAAGVQATGIEIVERLRERAIARGHTVHGSIEQIDAAERFDAIVMIDSLYYLEDPHRTLTHLRRLLHPDGILLLRITNRTALLNALRRLRRPITNAYFGDGKHNFTVRGARELLRSSGFTVEKILCHEKGKRISRPLTRLYYRLSLLATALLRTELTPGVLVIGRPHTG